MALPRAVVCWPRSRNGGAALVGGRGFRLDQEAEYRIWVAGQLEPGWWDTFEGFSVATGRSTEDAARSTCLTGEVADQAALYGLLHRLYALGFPLLSVECLTQPRPGREETEGR